MGVIIGREPEAELLEKILHSNKAEFIAVYGRRRIGKTYLIREFFKNKVDIYLQITGIKDASLTEQLHEFKKNIEEVLYNGMPIMPFASWIDALEGLKLAIKKTLSSKKIKNLVIFIDELPWLATEKSGCLQAIDSFWNTFLSEVANAKLIICGSAATWIINNVINSKGGLHNRITKIINLMPFNLHEVRDYLKYLGLKYTDSQVIDVYMTMGGVPFYLNQFEKGLSVQQNIANICFSNNGVLQNEFNNLYKSLFDKSENHLQIIKYLSETKLGLSRNELIKLLKKQSGSAITRWLVELEKAGFIASFIPFGNKKKDVYYRLIDEFSLFYLHWVSKINIGSSLVANINPQKWLNLINTPEYYSWAGFAFEALCFHHIEQIANALKIQNIGYRVSSFRYASKAAQGADKGLQIDLLFDRDDKTITLCEIKYSKNEFAITKEYAKKLHDKIEIFKKKTDTKKQLSLVLISADKTKESLWQDEVIDKVIYAVELFKN